MPALATSPEDASRQLSVVLPACNEEATIAEVLTRLYAVFPHAEFVLVLNATQDATQRVAEHTALELGAYLKVIELSLGGKGRAMRTGAAASQRPWLLFHDTDLEYAPEDAKAVVADAQRTHGLCIGERLVLLRQVRLSSWLANRLIAWLLKHRHGGSSLDVLSGTRALSKEAFMALNTQATGFQIETEMTANALRQGLRLSQVPVRYMPRTATQGKKIKASHLFGLIAAALG